ncbi:hypothetical protein EW145_g7752 [Phellinidium pouzarii]|uniref:Uncharacterized protein n=1 Tax=Phellinidium pouzarii TaxID=167371 RepID=A0A4V3XA41_9AGAM|nr:hypothetical protein EW145_g7752 [Phellinidium pouzarii]
MHTQDGGSINTGLAADLETSFTWEPPLSVCENNDKLIVPENIALEELDTAFSELEKRVASDDNYIDPMLQLNMNPDIITATTLYDLGILDQIDKGMTPSNKVIDVIVLDDADGPSSWSVKDLLRAKGVSF